MPKFSPLAGGRLSAAAVEVADEPRAHNYAHENTRDSRLNALENSFGITVVDLVYDRLRQG